MTRLSTYMSQARDRALPDEVLEQAKWHVLDTIAAMVSGSELAPGRAAITFARAYGGKEVATVVGDTVVCGPIEAALANGTMAHADETDDTLAGPVASGLQRRARGAGAGRAVRHQRRAFPAGGRARLRRRHAAAGRDPARARQQSQVELRHRRRVRRGGGRRLRGEPEPAADAVADLVRGAAELGHRVVSARSGSHREGLHLRRHGGAQRRDVGAAGARRLERRERHPVGARQLPQCQRRRRPTPSWWSKSSASATT